MTRVANDYVITMVNFNTCKIKSCGAMVIDELLSCIKDKEMCFFFGKEVEA